MTKAYKLEGRQFNRLTVIARSSNSPSAQACWKCRCVCGNEVIVPAHSLVSNNTKSCGCLSIERLKDRVTKHGHSSGRKSSLTYNSWQAMNQRCTNPNSAKFSKYGAIGIEVCDRWKGQHGFEHFLQDMGERPEGTTLGRFGDVGNYEPSNCKWMTPAEQRQNWRVDRNAGACSSSYHGKRRYPPKPPLVTQQFSFAPA